MKRLVAASLLLAGCQGLPLSSKPVDAPATLAAAESAFAAQSVREGLRAAFLAWLAPGATLFRDGPVDGPATIAREPDPPIVLDWRPAFVETAASGEMGLSTGPWKITRRSDPSAAPRYGQFISVWRRGAQGAWRVHVDLGISHPGAALWDAPLQARTTPAAPAASGAIDEAEADFARMARAQGTASAYAAWGAADLRLYREGFAPRLGREAALAHAGEPAGALDWVRERSETSEAGDLGFATGHYARAGEAKAGHFVRVWRRESAGWRIAADVVDPAKRR